MTIIEERAVEDAVYQLEQGQPGREACLNGSQFQGSDG